jgi:hypothetical protein
MDIQKKNVALIEVRIFLYTNSVYSIFWNNTHKILTKSTIIWDIAPCNPLKANLRRDFPEDSTLQTHSCENLKSYIEYLS